MHQLTLQIDDSKFNTFLEFIKTLDYVHVKDIKDDPFIIDLYKSLEQVKKIKSGELPNKSIEALLHELKN